MVTIERIISELINPLLGLVGVVLRAIGGLGVGLVAGAALRHGIDFKMQARFFVPLIFLGVAIMLAVVGYGTWSSPGTVATFGIGLFIGYQMLRRRAETSQDDADQD